MRITIPDLQTSTSIFKQLSIEKLAQELLSELLLKLLVGLYSISELELTNRLICTVSTGIGIKMPSGHFGLIKEHSSLALKGSGKDNCY